MVHRACDTWPPLRMPCHKVNSEDIANIQMKGVPSISSQMVKTEDGKNILTLPLLDYFRYLSTKNAKTLSKHSHWWPTIKCKTTHSRLAMVDPSATTNQAAKNLHLPSFGCVLAKGCGRYRLSAVANAWWKLGIPRMDLLVDTHQKVKSLLGVRYFRYFSISSEMEWWTHSNHSLPSGMFHERDPYGLPIATGFPLENTCVVSICFLLACELIDVDQLWSTSLFSSTQTSSPTNPYKAYHPATPKTLPGSAQWRGDGVDDPHDGIGLQGCMCACCACRWAPWCGAGTGPAMHTSGHSPAGTPNF